MTTKKTIILLILVLLLSGCVGVDNGLKPGQYRAAETTDSLIIRDDGTFIDNGTNSYGGTYRISEGFLELHYDAMGLIAEYKIINSTAIIGYKNYTFVRS
jgi:hypothetical protein